MKTPRNSCAATRTVPLVVGKPTQMNKLNNPRQIKKLALTCAFTYLAGYLIRLNFAAVTVEIIRETGWEKSSIAAVTTALFVLYGVGQLISGFLGDRTKPEFLILGGLAVSSLMNIIIPFCSSISQMAVIWGLNGLSQAMLWPPVVKILSDACNKTDYQKSILIVTRGSALGKILTFALAFVCTTTIGWRYDFFITASIAIVASVIFILNYNRIKAYSYSEENINLKPAKGINGNKRCIEDAGSAIKMPRQIIPLLTGVLISVIVLGALRDSIMSWIPNYIAENFSTSASKAIFTSILLPIISIVAYPFVLKYYYRFFKSEAACASTFYIAASVSALVLYFVSNVSTILSVILLAFIVTCMDGANFLIIGLLCGRFEKFGNVSTISGLVNSFVYIGSSASIYGIALIAEKIGWQATVLTWGGLAIIGFVFIFSVVKGFKKHFN